MIESIGAAQLKKKLASFVILRRKSANFFVNLFYNDKRFLIQKAIGESSWFGFTIIIIDLLTKNKIDSRPIVICDFTKNICY